MGLVRAMDTRLSRVEEDNKKLASVVKELNDYVKKSYKESFTVKGSQYEVSNHYKIVIIVIANTYKAPIKHEMAKLFCLSLKRKPVDSDVQVTIFKGGISE